MNATTRSGSEICRLSQRGLLALGLIEIGVPAIAQMARLLAGRPSDPGRLLQSAAVLAIGLITTLLARLGLACRHARKLAWISAFASVAVVIAGGLFLTRPSHSGDDYAMTGLTLFMLTAVAAVPFRPLQALSLGAGIEALYILLAALAGNGRQSIGGHEIFVGIVAVLSTAVAVILYDQRVSFHKAHQEALRSAEILSSAQTRALLWESAVSVGKMAAALTHELNTPLGALRSAVDTMLVVSGRQATATPEQQERLLSIQAELRRSVRESADRLQQVIARLQRFVDTEKDEIQSANINDLLNDVTILCQEKLGGKIEVRKNLRPLPPLYCRPQQLTAVFSNLLSNAINAVNGNGQIDISTQRVNSQIEVEIRDNGRGMTDEELGTIFDPGFKVTEGRVSTGNWSLFSSRQIVHEHGGEIQIDSAEGKGTKVVVTLPCSLAGSA